ncbi:NAD(P)-dependent alcohol dehydrogenase [Wenxinia saemankumensis]|uniref:D-xylulose reductase n=1 Tax=Wenxinia saemankumensis TaxID=1447782 RepID=A0A1M6EJY3_9RHOB|nr:NAD(P)-dependent alcohol dehydrogenase [Wenxinia saemankumensis]SHI85811.1 D-xylulose reductase [Wenxinia saemankumensis]
MRALVLEKVGQLSLREFPIEERLGPRDVRIDLKVVGICGSDLHYYTHGRIGPFVVEAPMILGHEAAGVVTEVGAEVAHLVVGDRVCMEPGIPDQTSRAARQGMYNVDPAVRFWATPPVHGILRPSCTHPADYCFKLPQDVSFAEGAMVEPLAVGVHAATKARIRPGDTALVLGAGPIGLLTAMAARAGGCARVWVADLDAAKLEIARGLGFDPIDVGQGTPAETILPATEGWGCDVVYEATGSPKAAAGVFAPLAPGGCVVMIGGQSEPVPYDAGAAMVREARVENIFRYAHVFPRCVAMIASGAIDVKPLITRTFAFEDSVEAFEVAASAPKGDVKMQIAF